jgi:acetyl esterase/lipase
MLAADMLAAGVLAANRGEYGRSFAMRWIHRVVALAALLLAAGCSGIDAINALVPRSGYGLEKDVAYGPDARQRFDLYVPDGADAASPVAVFFYGGGWTGGKKADYLFAGQALAERGYVVAIPNYRLFPQVRFPAFLEDSAAAVAAIRAHVAARNLGNGKLALIGHSAGAYNAAMLALDPQWLAAAGIDRCKDVSAFVGLAGPYNFLPLKGRSLVAIFGAAEPLAKTQPIEFAKTKAPPMLLLAGRNDGIVSPQNATSLAAAIDQAGGRATAKLYDNVGHADIVAAFARPFRGVPPSLDDLDRFLTANREGGC